MKPLQISVINKCQPSQKGWTKSFGQILSICKKEIDPGSEPNLEKARSPKDSQARHRCCSSTSFVSRQFTKTLAGIKQLNNV